MTASLAELRKYYSTLKDINSKCRTIMGVLPSEPETALEDVGRELVTLEGFDRDAKTSWSLSPKKRRLNKQIQEGLPKIESNLSRALQLHIGLLRTYMTELEELKATIMTFDLKLGRDLNKLSFPSTQGGFSVVLPVLGRFVSNLEGISKQLRDALLKQTNDMLEQNRALIKTYDRFVGIDTSDVSLSAERESIQVNNITDLFEMRQTLRKEHEYLTSRRGEVVDTLQAKLESSIESTISLLETARSLQLNVPMAISTSLEAIKKQIKDDSSLTTLLGLVQQYDGQILKASSEIRSQILEFEHELNRTLASANISNEATFLPPQPPEIPKDADLATLIASYERLQAYQTNVETAIRSETMRIIDDLTRAVKRDVLPHSKELDKFVKSTSKKVQKGELKVLVKGYSEVAARIIDEHGRLLAEIRTQEALLTRISETATTILDKTTMGAAPAPVRSSDITFTELVEAYSRLRKHVENRIDLFRKAWERELNALLAEIQVIKPTYRESFKTMEEFLEGAITQIRASTSFEEIEEMAREAQGDALYKAQDAIENLKYRLDLKLRLAVSKLLGMNLTIPPEVQSAIQELTTIVPASETYEEAIRKAHHIVELFEKRIVGYFNQTLNEQIKAYSELTTVAATLGINADAYVKKCVKLQDKLPATIEDLPDRFDELRELLTEAKLLKDLRAKANEVWRNLNSVTDLLERHGQAEIVIKLKELLARVPDALETEQVTTVLEICMALVEAQKSVLDILRNMEQKTAKAFEGLLENTTEYYSTIRRVYDARPREFSKIIFPLDTLQNLREKLETANSLPEAINIFTTIRDLESQWLDKIKELDEWHKALRVLLADYNPAAPKAERNRQLNEIEKRIRETYTREDTANYLVWAARELAAVMSEKSTKTKKK
ncbi:MAG: hypothetical protein ACFFBU_09370 [Promethearchaeota archaeon]